MLDINIREFYEQAKEEARPEASSFVVVDELTGKVFEEDRKFYLCGRTQIGWKHKGKNTDLKGEFLRQGYDVRKHYYGGLYVYLEYSNGEYTLAEEAVGRLIGYLRGKGYDVYNLSSLD